VGKIKMPQANTFAAKYYYRILCAEIKICEHRLPLLISYQPLPSSLTNIKFDFFSAENVLCTSSFPLRVATGIRTNA